MNSIYLHIQPTSSSTCPPGRNLNEQPSTKLGDTENGLPSLRNKQNIYIQSPIFLYTQFSEYNKIHYKYEEGGKCDSELRETVNRSRLAVGKLLKLAGKDFNRIHNSMFNLKEKMDIICEEMGHFKKNTEIIRTK